MERFVSWFVPQPARAELPPALNSPFDTEAPPPLAARAAEEVMHMLRDGHIGPSLSTDLLRGPEGGKMFGVLVVEDAAGRVGYLRAFSGQLARVWDVEGFVPPVFDRRAREVIEPAGERAVKELTDRVEAARTAQEWIDAERELREVIDRHESEAKVLRERHRLNRAQRRSERLRLAAEGLATADALHRIDQLSRADDAELRRAKARRREERTPIELRHRKYARRIAALERLRRVVSRRVALELFDTYQLENAAKQRTSLRALFAPELPSSGTGDCAAPKLIVFALQHGLRPLALAEFWWGDPPPGGARRESGFFPACRDKCGALLPFLLEGLPVARVRRFRPPELEPDVLPIVFEDDRLAAVDKPAGLLSVPGTDKSVTDSVLSRMRARYPHASGPLLVHRLDLETSGLLLIALDARAHTILQRQFIARTVRKKYVAWLEGDVERSSGVIELPLRVDLEQRPRQIVDFVHGKKALTRFEVLERRFGRTRVAFYPETGRTHQLRVHAAHTLGLAAPIAGDRLYGRPDERLMLHAESIAFFHPTTGELVELRSPAPF